MNKPPEPAHLAASSEPLEGATRGRVHVVFPHPTLLLTGESVLDILYL